MRSQVMKAARSAFSLSQKRELMTRRLVYKDYGEPAKAIFLETVDLPEKLGPREVLIRWLAAPINPADINQIQGVYPVKPPLPAVGGNEGYGVVDRVGSEVRSLTVGDLVQSALAGIGTWREYGIHDQNHLFRIDAKGLSHEAAATLQVNPPTAYRMLKDFVDLKPGDVIIQNGANSAVGRAVIQISRALGVKTVNVIRDRPELNALIAELKALGADEVLTEEELLKERGRLKNMKLALNCVGGKSALMLTATLGKKGAMVTYGGMSKQPLQVPTGPLIFNDVRLYGFWMTRWYADQTDTKARFLFLYSAQERTVMFKELVDWIREGKLHPPNINRVRIADFKDALTNASTKYDKKQLFVFEK